MVRPAIPTALPTGLALDSYQVWRVRITFWFPDLKDQTEMSALWYVGDESSRCVNYAVALDCEPCWTWGASNRFVVRCIILQSYSYAVPHNEQIW
jgi:hypothetical protein